MIISSSIVIISSEMLVIVSIIIGLVQDQELHLLHGDHAAAKEVLTVACYIIS